MSNSVRLHRQQPARLPHPWDSPGKNFGVGCHFLLQFMKVKKWNEVAQSCLTLSDPMGFSRPEYWSGVPLPSLIHYSTQDQFPSPYWASLWEAKQLQELLAVVTFGELDFQFLLYIFLQKSGITDSFALF